MSKHSHAGPDYDRLQRGKVRFSAGASFTVVVLVLLLGFLGISLQSFAGVQDSVKTPVTAAAPFDHIPDDALTPEPVDLSNPERQAAPVLPPTQQPPAIEAPVPAASAPLRITYASAGIDVPIRPLGIDQFAQESQSIVPPFTLDGYWLSPFGTPGNGSTDTTYVVGHSWEDRDAPFNRLSDSAKTGDTFTVATGTGLLTYRVDSVTTFLKSSLKDSDIWSVQPNRIVLISCYTEDPRGKNVVVIASPLPAPAPS